MTVQYKYGYAMKEFVSECKCKSVLEVQETETFEWKQILKRPTHHGMALRPETIQKVQYSHVQRLNCFWLKERGKEITIVSQMTERLSFDCTGKET